MICSTSGELGGVGSLAIGPESSSLPPGPVSEKYPSPPFPKKASSMGNLIWSQILTILSVTTVSRRAHRKEPLLGLVDLAYQWNKMQAYLPLYEPAGGCSFCHD